MGFLNKPLDNLWTSRYALVPFPLVVHWPKKAVHK